MSALPDIQMRTLYDQVRDEFVRRVITGEWERGAVIQNEADLARELGVSLGTVRKAFNALTEMQMIVRVPGKGTTVVDQMAAKSSHRFIHTRTLDGTPILGDLVVSKPHLAAASLDIAAVFRLPVGTPMVRFQRFRVHRDRVFTTEVVHIPSIQGDTLSIEERAKLLWFDHDVTVDKAERIDIVVPSEDECDALEVQPGTPLFRSVRVIYGYRARVLEHRVGYICLGSDLRFMMGPPEGEIAH